MAGPKAGRGDGSDQTTASSTMMGGHSRAMQGRRKRPKKIPSAGKADGIKKSAGTYFAENALAAWALAREAAFL